MDWTLARLRGAAGELHAREVDYGHRSVTVCEVTETAVVLGSTQHGDGVRRRSGGGAVLLAPGDPLWVDVVVPRHDPLWHDDVGRAFWWLGKVWAELLGGQVHHGGLVCTRWSRQVCFGGMGPGEVAVGGRKVVGISQRRTRDGALFQCAVYRTWDPRPLVAHLGLPAEAVDELAEAAVGVGDRLDTLEADFFASLPA
ncbi:MAG TPA: hypothetical protein VM938_04975 [Acidimicrobiales bacterium]|nr:hypothetical protein [Acidimicrobiales bacterium]